jgi:hypothetical protein
MGRYLDTYNVVWRAKQEGQRKPPRLSRHIRERIQIQLLGTRMKTLFDSPESSRLWREFESACRRLDRNREMSRATSASRTGFSIRWQSKTNQSRRGRCCYRRKARAHRRVARELGVPLTIAALLGELLAEIQCVRQSIKGRNGALSGFESSLRLLY